MTKFSSFIAFLVLAFVIAALAQNSAVIAFNSPLPVQTSLSACTWPTGQPLTGGALCIVAPPTGSPYLALSIAGSAFTPQGSLASGVASFNGRTGAVTLTDADVTGTGLKVATTVTTTSTSTAVSTPQ